MSYVTHGSPRFAINQTNNGEILTIPSVKNILIIILLSVWLGGWTIGGMAAARQLAVAFHPFLAFCLCAWAVVWLMGSFILFWMLTGKQQLRFVGPDLEIETSLLWFSHRALYLGRDIRGLKILPVWGYWQGQGPPLMPLLRRPVGAVQFNYGARTHSTSFGLGELEALAVIDWLRTKLPKASA